MCCGCGRRFHLKLDSKINISDDINRSMNKLKTYNNNIKVVTKATAPEPERSEVVVRVLVGMYVNVRGRTRASKDKI